MKNKNCTCKYCQIVEDIKDVKTDPSLNEHERQILLQDLYSDFAAIKKYYK